METAIDPTPSTNPASDSSQRDESGRFKKGNRGGPGNPFTRQTARLRQVALDAISEDDIRAVFVVLKEKALQGDVAAIKLLLSYTVGKPMPAADPDTIDQHELKTMLDNHSAKLDDLARIQNGMPVELLLIILRAALPGLFEAKSRMAHAVFSAPPTPKEKEETPGPAAGESAGLPTRTGDIPAWMYEMVNADQAAIGKGADAAEPESRHAAGNAQLLSSLLERAGLAVNESQEPNDGEPKGNGGNGETGHGKGGVDPTANGGNGKCASLGAAALSH